MKPAPASLARFVSDRRFSDSGEHWTNRYRDNLTRRNYEEEEELPVDYAFLDEDEELDYNSVDHGFMRRKREAECELCLKTGLHVVYKRKDVGEDVHAGDYSEYRLQTSISRTVPRSCHASNLMPLRTPLWALEHKKTKRVSCLLLAGSF